MEQETNGDGRPVNLPGIYEHPETGAQLIARRHRKFADAQADAYVQVGFKYVGPEPKVSKVSAKAEVKESEAEVETKTEEPKASAKAKK